MPYLAICLRSTPAVRVDGLSLGAPVLGVASDGRSSTPPATAGSALRIVRAHDGLDSASPDVKTPSPRRELRAQCVGSFARVLHSRRDRSSWGPPELGETLGILGTTSQDLGTTSQDLGTAADVLGRTSRWPRITKRGGREPFSKRKMRFPRRRHASGGPRTLRRGTGTFAPGQGKRVRGVGAVLSRRSERRFGSSGRHPRSSEGLPMSSALFPVLSEGRPRSSATTDRAWRHVPS
jgi:hypothetical protein